MAVSRPARKVQASSPAAEAETAADSIVRRRLARGCAVWDNGTL